MNIAELKRVASKKTFQLLIENGVRVPLPIILENSYDILQSNGVAIVCTIYFSDKNGKTLKEKKNIFYNYFNARVKSECISFVYSEQELMIEEISSQKEEEIKLGKVLQKINKLLSISEERGASENEAMIASMKAQELMKQYNLDYAKITGKSEKNEDILELYADTPVGYKWKGSLAYTIASSYCCKVYKNGDIIIFRGFKSDILIARRVFYYLFETCIKLGKKYERMKKKTDNNTASPFTSFCLGFLNGVAQCLGENCKALTLTVPKIVEDDWANFSENFKRGNYSFNIKDMNAYDEGVTEGKRAVNGQYISCNCNNKNMKNINLISNLKE